jgi:competence protein ComEC
MVSPLIIAALAAALGFYAPRFFLPAAAVLTAAVLTAVALTTVVLTAAALALAFLACCFTRGAFFPRYVRFPGKAAACCCGLFIGIWAGTGMTAPALGLPQEHIISLSGKLLEDPRSFGDGTDDPENRRGMAVLELKKSGAVLPGTGTVHSSARGRALVFFPGGTMPRLTEFGRGAEIFVEGRFLDGAPDGNAGGRNAGGQKTGGQNAGGALAVPRFRAVSVHVVQAAPVPEQLRTALRGAALKRLERKDWGGLAAALLLGTRENLDGDLALAYRDAGLSHILALSGMHLAFLSALLVALLKKPLGKKGALMAGLCFIGFYVFLVGPQPSLIRSAIMYVLGSCMVLTGTAREPLTLLGAAFLVQLLWDPSSAMTVSFILSYLALGGILVLSGSLGTLMKTGVPPAPANGLAASLGAFLATAPAVVLFFGILRPVGIAGGFLAVPLSTFFMALALGEMGLGNIPLLGNFLDQILSFVQFLLGKTVAFFALAPGIRMLLPAACAGFPLAGAAVLFLAGRQKRYRSYLAPFA